MALEPIRVARFEESDRAKVQDEAIAYATATTEGHIRRYIADPLSHSGRYVAADLFKETFPAVAQDPERRNRYNTPVHNAAAVLSRTPDEPQVFRMEDSERTSRSQDEPRGSLPPRK